MFEAEKARQARAKEEQMEDARNPQSGGGGRKRNSMNNQSPPGGGGSSDLSRSETVRYINDGDDGDEDTLSVIN